MRKHLKRAFICLIIFSCLVSIMIIVGAIMLHKYSKEQINEEILDSVRSDGKACFYRYERAENGFIINVPIQINSSSSRQGYITFDLMPDNLKNAFIAIEDKRFYSHSGIDYSRSIAAILNHISKGKKSFGGSTITQQLVKNLTGNDKVLVERKLSEAFAAMDLEQKYDKSEILEIYLNIINLSHGCKGVADAAHFYFSKKTEELNLCESATIAAITNNPSKYDPMSHPIENKKRRDLILRCMYDQGFISFEDYSTSVNQDTVLKISEAEKEKNVNSWYIDTVIEDVIGDLAEKYGITKKTASVIFYKGGYNVYTALEQDIQNTIETFYTDINNFPKDSEGNIPQSSMIVIDPHSGDILGIVGAIGNKTGERLLNYATQSKRPSGSAIKPISVYAPALDRNLIQWSSIIEDSPIRAESKSSIPWPSNANNKYIGNVTVDYAVKHSLNTVPVKVLHMLGNEAAFDFLHDSLMIRSLDRKKDVGDASLALGQHSVGITLRELVSAYTLFIDGIMKKTRTYYKVTDNNGRVILDNSPVENRVISEESAAIMTKLLQNVVKEGTASYLISSEEFTEVAGKTGTTQYAFDKYFVGYTPTLLAGVWQGFDMPKSLDFIGFNYSALVWDQIMAQIYSDCKYCSQQTTFDIPDTVQKLSYMIPYEDNVEYNDPTDSYDEGWFDVKNTKLK